MYVDPTDDAALDVYVYVDDGAQVSSSGARIRIPDPALGLGPRSVA